MTLATDALRSLLHLGESEHLIRFGNPDGADADYLAVVDENVGWRWDFRGLDLLVLSRQELQLLLAEWDPRAVEPVLTGAVVHGAPAFIVELSARLRASVATPAIAEKLWWRGCDLIRAASERWERVPNGVDDSNLVQQLLNDLGFGISLVELGRAYHREPRSPLLLKELAANQPLLAECRALLSAHKRGRRCTEKDVTGLIDRSQSMLLHGGQ